MISQQQILIDFSYTDTIPNYTKNPMTESKKFCMKGLTVLKNLLQPIRETEGSINFHDKISEMIQEEGYPMTESKKFCMKGLKDPQTMLRRKSISKDSLSEHGLKILDRCYTPKKVKVISSDITTKSKSGIFHSLIRCKFLIKSNFESFLFTNNKNFKK